MSNIPQLPEYEIKELIKDVGPKRTVVVQGETGVGKTAVQHAIRQDAYFANHRVDDVVDCTLLSDGSVLIPDIDRELQVSREYPNERWGVNKNCHLLAPGSVPSVICLDEAFKAKSFILNMLAPIIHDRRIGNLHFPEGTHVWATSNLSAEGLGDSVMAHFRSRVVLVQQKKPSMLEWKNNFAIPARCHPTVIAWADQNPRVFDSFLDYMPGGKYEGKDQTKEDSGNMIFNPRIVQDGFVSPRTLHMASDVLLGYERNGGVGHSERLLAALIGSVGYAAAQSMYAFVRAGHALTPFERVVADPENAPLTDNAVAQIIQVNQFITRCETRSDVAAVAKYIKRMRTEMQTMFVQYVAESPRIPLFGSVTEFQPLLRDNKLFLNVK